MHPFINNWITSANELQEQEVRAEKSGMVKVIYRSDGLLTTFLQIEACFPSAAFQKQGMYIRAMKNC